MRKLLIVAAFVAGLAASPTANVGHAQTFPVTPHLGFCQPPQGASGWAPCYNNNFSVLDTTLWQLLNAYQGTWNSAATYQLAQLVKYSGTVYYNTVANSTNQTPGVASNWIALGSGGGGGAVPGGSTYSVQTNAGGGAFQGTTLNGLGVFSSTAFPRVATYADIVNMFGMGSCGSLFLKGDGTCAAPGGGIPYPPAGIPLSTGTAWGSSYTAPAGALVGTTDTQTLTNKTVDGVSPATMGYVDPTSSIQSQLNAKAPSNAVVTIGTTPCTLGQTCNPNQTLAAVSTANCIGGYVFVGLAVGSTTVSDFCGNGNTATINGSPTLSQYGMVLNNNGTYGQFVGFPQALNSTFTFVFAAYWPTYGTQYGVNWGNSAGGFATNPSPMCGTDSSLICFANQRTYMDNAGKIGQSFVPNTPFGGSVPNDILTAGEWHIVTFVCGRYNIPTDTVDQVYYDGRPIPMGNVNGNCPSTFTAGNYQLGGSSLLTGTWGSMLATAFIGYSDQKSPTQVAGITQSLNNYLNSIGAIGTTPNGTSYRGNPVLNMAGDSRTDGGPVVTYGYSLILDDPNWVLNHLGYAGSSLDDMAWSPTWLGNTTPYGNSKTADVVWSGINDIVGSGSSTALCTGMEANYQRVMKRIHEQGGQGFLMTELPGVRDDLDAMKNCLDPVIRDHAVKDWGAASVIDLVDVPVLGADGASLNPTYFLAGNNAHPTTIAQANIIAPIVSNAINEYYGSTDSNFNQTSSTSYQELAKDGYLQLTGTSAQSITLPDCQGYTRSRTVWNPTAFAGTLAAGATGFYSTFTQYIDGLASIAIPANSSVVVKPVPGPMSTGGCSWRTVK